MAMLRNHLFVGHKQHYQSIPLEKRSSYLLNLLNTPQDQGQVSIPKEEYPHEARFVYKQHKLNYYYAESTSQPEAVLFYLHGLNSYGGASAYMGVNIAKAVPNVNVYALDFLNFGKSKGDEKGYIQSFKELISQTQAFVDSILSKFQKKKPKIFLIGASLGGTISFRMTMLKPQKYEGVIFLSPGLRQLKQSQYIMKKIGKLIGYFFPKLKLTPQNDDDSTRYPLKEMIKSNKLNYNGRHIPGSIRVALNAIEQTQHLYQHFKTPYILFQSGIDKVIDPFAPLDLERQCKAKDKTTIYMKQMWHSLFYEQQFKEVVAIAVDWLKQRI